MKKINLETLYGISNLPALLSSNNPKIRWKNHQSVSREFEIEKWGSLVSISKKDNTSVEILEKEMHEDTNQKPFIYKNELFIDTPINISKFFLDETVNFLRSIYKEHDCKSVIEIGAGYGRLLIPFVNQLSTKDFEYVIATDYTSSSGLILDNLSRNLKYDIHTSQMDISGQNKVDHTIGDLKPKRPIIFSCQTAMYVPFLEESFIELMKLWPDGVFCNIEPIYKKSSNDKLVEMQSRYIEVNDYNKNLENLLNEKAKKGIIKIVSSRNSKISENAFLPLKNIVWKFT